MDGRAALESCGYSPRSCARRWHYGTLKVPEAVQISAACGLVAALHDVCTTGSVVFRVITAVCLWSSVCQPVLLWICVIEDDVYLQQSWM